MRRQLLFAFAVVTFATRASAEEDATAAAAAPAAAPAPAPAAAEAPVAAEEAGKPWRFSGTLGVLTLPRPLSIDLLARRRAASDPRWDVFAVGLGLDYLPTGLANFGESKLSWFQLGAEGRWFPWRFVYVGARLGWQSVTSDSVKFGSDVHYATTAFVFEPKAGILHTFANGLTIGGELGAGIPIGADTSLESDGTEDSNGRKVAKTFGMFTMPAVSLFRIGYTL